MQSKRIKGRVDHQRTSRSVRLTAQTMVTKGPNEVDVSIVGSKESSFSTAETQSNPVANALTRLEGVRRRNLANNL